jgi:hypothetical protein
VLDVFAAARRSVPDHHRTPRQAVIVEDSGLGLERTVGVTVIQIFQQGRSNSQKVAYEQLAKCLQAACGIRPQDLIVSVIGNKHANWSRARPSAVPRGDL